MILRTLHPGKIINFGLILVLRRISCHGRNHLHTRCEYSQTNFLCYHHYSEYSLLVHRGCSEHRRDIMSTAGRGRGDICVMSTVAGRGIMSTPRDTMINMGKVFNKKIEFVSKPQLVYRTSSCVLMIPPNVLSILLCTHDIIQCTEHRPVY